MIKCDICELLEKFEVEYIDIKTRVIHSCYEFESYEPCIKGFIELVILIDDFRNDLGLK